MTQTNTTKPETLDYRLETVTIKDFLGIKEAAIALDPHVTVLIGLNGGGKTTLLRALALWPQPGQDTSADVPETQRHSHPKRTRHLEASFKSVEEGQAFTVDVGVDINGMYKPEFKWSIPKGKELTAATQQQVDLNSSTQALNLIATDWRPQEEHIDSEQHRAFQSFRCNIPTIHFIGRDRIAEHLAAADGKTYRKAETALRQMLGELRKETPNMPEARLCNRAQASINNVLKRMDVDHYVQIGKGDSPGELMISRVDQRNREVTSLHDVSDGEGWAISVAIEVAAVVLRSEQKNSGRHLLLFEEPGVYTHVSEQRKILRYLEKLGETYQIIYTTHSPYMINRNARQRIRVARKNSENGIAYFPLEREENIPAELSPVEGADALALTGMMTLNTPILIVEGSGDIEYINLALEELQRRSKSCSIPDDLNIISAGGVSNIVALLKLCHRKAQVYVLVDSSSKNSIQQGEIKKIKAIAAARAKNLKDESQTQNTKVAEIKCFFENKPEESDIEDMFGEDTFLEMVRIAYLGNLDWPEETKHVLNQEKGRQVNIIIDHIAEKTADALPDHQGAQALKNDRTKASRKHGKTADRLRQASSSFENQMGNLETFQSLFRSINNFFKSTP
ncbi:ATP-dependent nuclease [Deinococcus sp. SM5_A1]|uniref:ATP-dependent nuclease n=1 Tax=Deinococcus sp. SM5_A1 TaxID=3379094 RepID=UPI00385FF920